MQAIQEQSAARLWALEFDGADSESTGYQAVWKAVILMAVRDLLGFEKSDLTISAFAWVFCDPDFDTVADLAGLEAEHLRPRLAALVKVNAEAVAHGRCFLYKNGRGVCLKEQPRPSQQAIARELLQCPMGRAVFETVPAFNEVSEALIRRIHRETVAQNKKRKEIAA